MGKCQRLKIDLKLIFLAVLLVILAFILLLKVPYPKIYLNETVSITGKFIRALARFFTNIFK